MSFTDPTNPTPPAATPSMGQATGQMGLGQAAQAAQLSPQQIQQAIMMMHALNQNMGQQQNQQAQMGLNYQPFRYTQKEGSQGFLGPLLGGIGGHLAGPLAGGIAGGISSLFKPKASAGGIS